MIKDENEPIVACNAFDAAAIDPHNQGSKGLFVFNFQPIDGSYRTKVVNLETRDNGRIDDEIIERKKEIQKNGEEFNIIFRFMASDYDSKTNKLHAKFREYIWPYEKQLQLL